ncbi:uncharacterized protein LOC127580686 [Pristis pectinata]|uniref:uncharacterized protein LOC127580686 n=1 Tax=Pristis pectinata TaxID=685728 RepID=UPI00223C9ED2|nr:uncharacterized protein LOC127580686 [Pristis pectinata]XP_051890395.1 uncharacterized protein LOC127580686 [Pristis pectinata]XP_051890396.1 uncharacterized protein LOC127580686 [Pristis pectinata]XP_051890397.1 uncharacterized protein LOC127580686 [Pristis pectinata]XP_051890398.1 uncharacterized protein LOC127580686 [Pristis pectinata]XP_051890399.1 uncharacterized protein LOC127580686 [Pristis pectinata]
MNQNQLSPEPQTALSPKPCSNLSSGCEQVHSSIASPASGLAASPSPAAGLGIVQSVASPGTYIQIPINAEVRCVSTLSLPTAVQKKIYGGTCNLRKGTDSSKPSTAIYIYPVNPVKLTDIPTKRLLPLMHKPSSSVSVTDSEKPISSPAEVQSKETSSGRQDTKTNRSGKEATVTPTPVSVKFCNNLASQVLKTYVKQQGKGGSMDDLMQTYFNSPLEIKTANSFKDNALLLFNGQLFFLAQKGIEVPTGAEKGKLTARESGTREPKAVQGGPGPATEPGCFEQRIDTGQTSASSSTARHEVDSQVVKRLPNSLPGSCVRRSTFSENRDLLLKAGIHLDVRVRLYRISLNGNADTSGRWLERPVKSVPQLSKEPDPVNFEGCPKLSREPELVKLEECPELSRECDPAELKECPELSREVDFGGLEENSDTSKVPVSFPSQECPKLSKESGPVVMEECAAISRVLKPELEGCPIILREPSPATLEECHGNSKNNVSVALQEDGDACKIPSSADFREHLKPTVNSSSADLKGCLPESDEGCHRKCRTKRKEVEIEIQSSGCLNPNWDDDKSGPNKRSKHHGEITSSKTSVDSKRETCGLLNVKKPTNSEAENSATTPLRCLLELNNQQSESPSQDGFHPPEQENPLEVDDTVRDEKINRLKEILKEKQAALDRMRKRVSLSSSGSCSELEPLQ